MDSCRVILEMIGELHGKGFQTIRLCPRLSNSGVHWIAWITSAEQVLPNHGAILHPTAMMQAMKSPPNDALAACYTSTQGAEYFGWADAAKDSPGQLAEKFIGRFPQVCANGRQLDPEYVNWYKSMLVVTGPEGLPSTCSTSPETGSIEYDRLVVLRKTEIGALPLPPTFRASREQS